MRGWLLGYGIFAGVIAFAGAVTGVIYGARWLLLGPLGLSVETAGYVGLGVLILLCATSFAWVVAESSR